MRTLSLTPQEEEALQFLLQWELERMEHQHDSDLTFATRDSSLESFEQLMEVTATMESLEDNLKSVRTKLDSSENG
jgi:hypothetical protein